ncbi:MAG TPA: TerC family protein [Thermomicrobiales bacterium]|nr:TerC family protein [Thermomicrobiales bacterium]HRA32860.1 TerC family protein [Thermomicrobiales bacterium]
MAESIGSPWLWAGFTAFVLLLLTLDLGIFHRRPHAIGAREAALWTAGWVALAAVFNVGVYLVAGSERGLEFTAGYLVELALSVDNMFVFALIFGWFVVPKAYQHRVLFWGILGALVMRAVFILLGSALLQSFHWIIYIFGAFLIYTGFKILRERETQMDLEMNLALRLLRRLMPVTNEYHGQRFTIVEAGKRIATPLMAVLVLIEATDLVFALDSVPAIFAITDDPFIVYTSNVFAILGLRSLYFLLAGIMDSFRYLKVGLGAVLMFVGAKMALSDVYHMPIGLSLGVIVALIGGSVVLSLLRPAGDPSHVLPERSATGAAQPPDSMRPSVGKSEERRA